VDRVLGTIKADYCILVIPLLLESEYDYDLNRILVVDSHPEQQIERVVARDQVKVENAQQILAHQISREKRLAQADDIIDNTHPDPKHLKEQVATLHQKYTELAHSHHP
jgi:dephospho-CoA kinase